jgi:prepilin-type processing-associated H-X9-DG protein
MNNRKKILFCALLSFLVCFSLLNFIRAQESSSKSLLSIIPDDVVFFAETSGYDILKPDFEKTILGRICNEPSVKTFYQSAEQSLMKRAQQESGGEGAATMINMVKSIAGQALSRPILIGAAQKTAQQGPPVYGFAVMDAGQKKDVISGILSNLESMAGEGEIVDVKVGTYTLHGPKDPGGVPVYWGFVGNYLVFAINDGEGLAIKYLQSDAKRTLQNYFQKSSITNDALSIYINVEKGLNLVKAIAKSEGSDDEFAQAEKVLNQLGVSKIKTITNRTGFDGTGLISEELVEMPQPYTGLFASLKPVNQDVFNLVDANAINVSAVNCDIAGIYDTVLSAIKSVAGEDFAEVENGIAELEKQTQVKIRQGLLESLSGKIVFYDIPGSASVTPLQGGFVVIAELKNAQLWQDSIAAISKFAAETSNSMVQVSSQVQNGRTLNTIAIVPLAMAQIMPTWTIVGENVVIGSSPAVCIAAAEQATPGARTRSIRNNENFQKAAAKLPSNLISFRYSDSKVQMTQLMAALQQLWPVATMYVAQQGITLPVVLPDLSNIIKDVTPSVQYSWFDEAGMHSLYKGAGIEPSVGAVAGGAIAVGVMMPALARTRQLAFRMVAGTNLSGIGKAMLIYANDFDDEFPPNLEVLAEKTELAPKMFESKRKPANFNGPTFIYITGQTTSSHPGNILVYENPEYCTDGINVLFLDSHVEFMKQEDFIKSLKATYERLKKPMPEIKFKNYGDIDDGAALPATRQQAMQITSMNNLKQLVLASVIYADENNGKFAENFDQLDKYINNKKVLDSPLKPANFSGPSYIYVSGHTMKDKNPASIILIYENPEYCADKINTAFLDGHVESLTRNDFLGKLKTTYEHLGRPMPEIKFKGQ